MNRRLVAALLMAGALAFQRAGVSLAADGPLLPRIHTLTVTDVLIGEAKTGPYTLSWNQIGGVAVSVSLNGLPLLRGADYTVDEAKGTVTFAKPLARTDVARVTYVRQPGVSQVNPVSFALPLAESQSGPLGLTLGASYLYQRSPDHGDILAHGFAGAVQAGDAGRLSGVFLLNDPIAERLGPAGPRRTGWQLSGQQCAGRLALTGSLSRADEGLAGGKAQGLEAGVEALNLGASYQAAADLTAGATFERRRDLAAEGTGTRAVGYSFAYEPDHAPSLGLVHTTTVSDDGESSLIEQKTDCTFLYRSPLGVTVGASLTDLNRGHGADEAAAKYALAYAGRDGLSLAAARVARSQEADGSGARAITDRFALKTRLGPRSVAAAAHEIQHTDEGSASATRLDLTTAFMEGVDFQAHYFASGIATPQTASQVGCKVTAIPLTQLSGRVGRERIGDSTTDIVGMGAVVTPVPAVSVGGGCTRRTRETGITDTRKANLTIAVADAVRLTGDYAENPTDDAGRPLLASRAKVNLTTRIGALSLGGSAGRQKDITGAESALYEAEVGLRLGPGKRVYTGYRLNNSLAGDLRQDDEVYRLGYSRDAGSNFSLALEAQILLYREDERLLAERTEHRAQASLNARF